MLKYFIYTSLMLILTTLILAGDLPINLRSESTNANRQLKTQIEEKQLVIQKLNLQPLAFTENHGQWDESVLFRTNAGGATMWFTSDGVYYHFSRRVVQDGDNFYKSFPNPLKKFDNEQDSIESIMIKASFVGANLKPNMIGMQEMEYKCNYFNGNEPEQWHTDVPNYEYVVYEDIYAGIDLKYYGNGKQMEYDFIVAAGVDPSQIRIKYEGAKSISVNEEGELEVETKWNTVTEQAPYIYQEAIDGHQEIIGKYHLLENNTFGFKLISAYDSSLPLIIDPSIEYSTYLGGSDVDQGFDIAVDNFGCAYVIGGTFATDFPILNPFQKTSQGSWDVIVTKLKNSGSSLLYSTYLGGSGDEQGWDIAIDSFGNAYITGTTRSVDFPVKNHYQTYQGWVDVFATKLNSNGNSIIYSTYLGGSYIERGIGITTNSKNNAIIVGFTASSDFPINNPYQTDQGVWDVFITILSIDGSNLVFSTYFGGGRYDYGYGITVDNNDNVYVTGWTDSPDFPTENPYQSYQGGEDVFVSKFSSSGNNLIYSTYLGGEDMDIGHSIAVDDKNNAYITGQSRSDNFPIVNNYQTYQGDRDVFVCKLVNSGDSLIYSTYLGGDGNDRGYGIAIDNNGYAYITGFTNSSNYPVKNQYLISQGKDDAFLTMLNPLGNDLTYSTYLGGNENDGGSGITLDVDDNVYIVGSTASIDYPINNPYQTTHNGYGDAFITKFSHKPISIRGDINSNGNIELNDALYLLSYLYKSDQVPISLTPADVNCDQKIDITDVTYLINFILTNGPEPCES